MPKMTIQICADCVDNPCSAGALSKTQEIAILKALCEQLPAGYLQDILTDCRGEIERAIRNDSCAILQEFETRIVEAKSLAAREEEKAKHVIESAEKLRAEFARAQRTIAEAERARKSLREAVSAVRDL